MNKEIGNITQDGQTEFTQVITGVIGGVLGGLFSGDKSPASLPSRASQQGRMNQENWPTKNVVKPDFSPVSMPAQRPIEMPRAAAMPEMPDDIEELLQKVA